YRGLYPVLPGVPMRGTPAGADLSGPGFLTDGFDSTTSSMRTLFPGARLGNCLRHPLNKLPGKLVAIASPLRKTLRTQFHTLLYRARQRKGLRVFALGQRLRHFADHVTATAGVANGER